VLGQLYDQVQLVEFEPDYEKPFDNRIIDAYPLDESILRAAVDIKKEYDDDMHRLMEQYGIRTEFEVWSTFVLAHNHLKNDYTFAETLGQIVKGIQDKYREACHRKAGGNDFTHLGPFLAAMYTITAQQVSEALKQAGRMEGLESSLQNNEEKLGHSSMPLISFPWLFHKELGKIANGRNLTTGRRMPTKFPGKMECHDVPPDQESTLPETGELKCFTKRSDSHLDLFLTSNGDSGVVDQPQDAAHSAGLQNSLAKTQLPSAIHSDNGTSDAALVNEFTLNTITRKDLGKGSGTSIVREPSSSEFGRPAASPDLANISKMKALRRISYSRLEPYIEPRADTEGGAELTDEVVSARDRKYGLPDENMVKIEDVTSAVDRLQRLDQASAPLTEEVIL
jgi:hypothetical protein